MKSDPRFHSACVFDRSLPFTSLPAQTFDRSHSLTLAIEKKKKKKGKKWQMREFTQTWDTHAYYHLVNKTGAVATKGLPIHKPPLSTCTVLSV